MQLHTLHPSKIHHHAHSPPPLPFSSSKTKSFDRTIPPEMFDDTGGIGREINSLLPSLQELDELDFLFEADTWDGLTTKDVLRLNLS